MIADGQKRVRYPAMNGRVCAAIAAAGLVATGLAPTASTASRPTSAQSRAADAVAKCSMQLGAVTPGGDHRGIGIAATSPPTVLGDVVGPRDLYPDGLARLSGPMASQSLGPGQDLRGGWLVLGSSLYLTGYTTDGTKTDSAILRRISGGWQVYTAFQTSRYYEGPAYKHLRMNQYALRYDGVLVRWTVQGATWTDPQTVAGFPSLKAMTLISQTRKYDTFIANTWLGALYSIRIPTTSPMVPIVRLVRASGWQEFETLIAERCGAHGTLLLGIDADTHIGRLYAVSRANGAATAIQPLGKVPQPLDDPVYFRWYRDTPQTHPLNGN